MKKIATLLLALIMVLAIASCGHKNEQQPIHKIGVIVYDLKDEQVQAFRQYMEGYLGKNFSDVDFLYSAGITTEEEEMEFLKDAIEEGVEGIIAFNSFDLEKEVELCASGGVYYLRPSSTTDPEDFDKVADNPYFLGYFGPGNEMEYQAGYDMAAYFAKEQITDNYLLLSGGAGTNVMHEQRAEGMLDALQEAYPDWSVRRAFTAQIIINHVQARDDEKIDNMQQALDRAVANGVKNLVVQPTHLMHGAEYDEMNELLDRYKDKFEGIAVAEPLLGEVGDDATVINADKEAVAKAITAEAVKAASYDDVTAAAEDGTAFVFMGHGTAHVAKVSYSQMQTTMETLGYTNVFVGTVEGEPEDTSCEAVIEKVKEAGFTKVVLRPLMVVAGDHANNDMAGDDEDSWLSQFKAADCFDSVDTQIAGLGEIGDIQQLYIDHAQAAIDSLNG